MILVSIKWFVRFYSGDGGWGPRVSTVHGGPREVLLSRRLVAMTYDDDKRATLNRAVVDAFNSSKYDKDKGYMRNSEGGMVQYKY
jgi:hypothetical protein